MLHNLAQRGFYVLHTDHLSDHELYAELWERGLRDPAHLPGRNPRGSNEERVKHAKEYPQDKLPLKERPISNRDWRLPKGPFG